MAREQNLRTINLKKKEIICPHCKSSQIAFSILNHDLIICLSCRSRWNINEPKKYIEWVDEIRDEYR